MKQLIVKLTPTQKRIIDAKFSEARALKEIEKEISIFKKRKTNKKQ